MHFRLFIRAFAHILAGVIFVATTVFRPVAAAAWDCDVHIGLAKRATIPIVARQNISGLPLEICRTHKPTGQKVNQRSQRPKKPCNDQQSYFDFVHGTQDPDDDDFRSNPLRERSHQKNARNHAIRAFQASARQLMRMAKLDQNDCGPESPFSTLGRSLHYLHDWGDPTKYLDSVTHSSPNTRKSVSRRWANKYSNELTAGYILSPEIKNVAGKAREHMRRKMEDARNLGEILRAVEDEREATAKSLRNAFHRLRDSQKTTEDHRLMDSKIAEAMVASIAFLEVAQWRWLQLWKDELKRIGNN